MHSAALAQDTHSKTAIAAHRLLMMQPSPLGRDAVYTQAASVAARAGVVSPANGPLSREEMLSILMLMSLRQALARLGASVSMAWDGKQAADLLAVVQPEVVVVDLGLTRRDGYLIAARLGALEAIPHAVLSPVNTSHDASA